MARGVALVLGSILYALALPPFDWSICGWVALAPLLVALRGLRTLPAFGYGAAYGALCSCTVGMSWIAPAIARFFDVHPAVGVGLACVYAVLVWGIPFGTFAAGAVVLLRRERSVVARLAIPALWVATELFRGRLVGQPWALLGYTQHAQLAIVQVAALTGVYGVSFLLAFTSTVLAEMPALLHAGHRRQALLTLALPVPLVAALGLAGTLVLLRGPDGGFAAQRVTVVQTNVEPAREWTRAYTDRQVMAHIQATAGLSTTARPMLVVWPENAVPRYLETEPFLGAQLASIASRERADLLFGAPRYEGGRTYNSVRLITAAGRDGGSYDKQRLVPLAERTPIGGDDPAPRSDDPGQFSVGTGPSTLRSFVTLGVSICHEILFPELIGRSVADGAALLVNVSNDGWLDGGHGIASRQHFAMAVLRSVETRRYLVRAATTGVSGVIDPFGRVVDVLPPGAAGTVSTSVAGRTAITPYVRMGDVFAFACVLAAVGALAGRRSAAVRAVPRLASASRTS
ncbi:MAG TPA: apolipoprotein N-acyltransferase [Candidatus Binatia bacterium]|nr:apolipoprotein N-acyltransferase [Candidatus Binatia bacterium]